VTTRLALIAGLGAVALAASPASAQQWYVGLYVHDVTVVGETLGLGAAGRESGTDLHLGYRTQRLDGMAFLGRPNLHAFVSINSNNTSNFAAVGLGWPIALTERLYLRPGIGLAYTDGAAGLPPANAPNLLPPERARREALYYSRIDFGSKVLFQPELALGYRFNENFAGEFSYTHLSNGQIFHRGKNQGLDDIGLRLVYSR
jgi:lipid A 3-O-deacylase